MTQSKKRVLVKFPPGTSFKITNKEKFIGYIIEEFKAYPKECSELIPQHKINLLALRDENTMLDVAWRLGLLDKAADCYTYSIQITA